MSIFAIGDLHLSFDGKVEKPMDIYGGAWVNHTEKLKEKWEKLVASEDTVLIPGDVSWALKFDEAKADLDWIDALPGKKIVTKGNHDLWWTSTNKLNRLYDDIFFLQNHCCEVENYVICGSRGWTCPGSDDFTTQDEKIYNRELLRMEFSLKEAESLLNGMGENALKHKGIIVMMHYPPTNDKLQASGFTELFEKYGVKLVIYGHLHGNDGYSRGFKGNFNGVEYKLVSLDFLNGEPIKL